MCVVLLTVLLLFSWAKADWELSVVTGEGVDMLDREGRTLSSCRLGLMGKTVVVASDWASNHLLLADSFGSNSTLYSQPMGALPYCKPSIPLLSGVNSSMMGVAYDPVEDAVYWTTGRRGTILRSGLNRTSGQHITHVVHSLSGQIPHAIAIDSCRRSLYWSNCNMSRPSIEMSSLDGSNKLVLMEEGLFQPVAITVSPGGDFLYWADEGPGYIFTVSRLSLTPTSTSNPEKEILVRSSHQQPISLAVLPGDRIYWMDRAGQGVWSLNLGPGIDGDSSPVKHLSESVVGNRIINRTTIRSPVKVKQYRDSTLSSLVVRQRLDQLDPSICSNVLEFLNKDGKGDKGDVVGTCEENYCLHGGECSQGNDVTMKPSCTCKDGFVGQRCQYESALCSVFCLDITAARFSDLHDICGCGRSAFVHANWSRENKWRMATICLSGVCTLLLLVTVALAYKTHILSKRPKLRRRITAEKKNVRNDSVGKRSVGRGALPGSMCEIGDIENCCNMNICETPCYEPELHREEIRRAGGGLESRSLISDMEVPEPTEPPL